MTKNGSNQNQDPVSNQNEKELNLQKAYQIHSYMQITSINHQPPTCPKQLLTSPPNILHTNEMYQALVFYPDKRKSDHGTHVFKRVSVPVVDWVMALRPQQLISLGLPFAR